MVVHQRSAGGTGDLGSRPDCDAGCGGDNDKKRENENPAPASVDEIYDVRSAHGDEVVGICGSRLFVNCGGGGVDEIWWGTLPQLFHGRKTPRALLMDFSVDALEDLNFSARK